jgi:uncharacterized protein (DUF1697 family)
MQKYVAFMTGIPLGSGPDSDTVRRLFTRLGFSSIQTFRSSDNVVFETAPVGVIGPLEAQISRHMRRSLGTNDIWTFIRTREEIAHIVRDVPFSSEVLSRKENHLFIVLLTDPLDSRTKRELRIRRSYNDEFVPADTHIYWLRHVTDESVAPQPLSEIVETHATVRSLNTLLGLHNLISNPVSSIKPGDELTRPGVIDASVSLAKSFFFFAKPVESDILKREKIFASQCAELFSQYLD